MMSIGQFISSSKTWFLDRTSIIGRAAILAVISVGGVIPASKAEAGQTWAEHKAKNIALLPSIHGWCTPEKADRMMELVAKVRPEVYVEVGVYGGSSFLPTVSTMQYFNKGIAYGIDPWKVAPCLEHSKDKVNNDWWSKIDLKKIMHGFIKKMHEQQLDNDTKS